MEKHEKEQLDRQLLLLQQKFDTMGQDMNAYLEGLLYAKYLSYWDYINLDTLLTLQQPKTDFPDEQIFVMYHQITELYFKLVLHELKQLANCEKLDVAIFEKHLKRVVRYFQQLVNSFDVMVEGMEKEQFLRFRMSLLPSSGFQSVQFRKIEICCTDFVNLLSKEHRHEFDQGADPAEMTDFLYWKSGASELSTGKKTLTLRRFEEKYSTELLETARSFKSCNLRRLSQKVLAATDSPSTKLLLRQFDKLVNVEWALAHFKAAARYLNRSPEAISATGGTNWQKYLPPKYQLVMFFPELWSAQEQAEWGKR